MAIVNEQFGVTHTISLERSVPFDILLYLLISFDRISVPACRILLVPFQKGEKNQGSRKKRKEEKQQEQGEQGEK